MEWIVQGVFSFLASSAFGIIFNSPKKTIFHCGLVGMTGWLLYYAFHTSREEVVLASFVGAFGVAIVAHILSKRHKMPMIIFSVAGIIPLVPGGMAYNAMRSFVQNDFQLGLSYGSTTLMVSGAIAMGLIFAEVIFQLIFRIFKERAESKG